MSLRVENTRLIKDEWTGDAPRKWEDEEWSRRWSDSTTSVFQSIRMTKAEWERAQKVVPLISKWALDHSQTMLDAMDFNEYDQQANAPSVLVKIVRIYMDVIEAMSNRAFEFKSGAEKALAGSAWALLNAIRSQVNVSPEKLMDPMYPIKHTVPAFRFNGIQVTADPVHALFRALYPELEETMTVHSQWRKELDVWLAIKRYDTYASSIVADVCSRQPVYNPSQTQQQHPQSATPVDLFQDAVASGKDK